MANTTNSRMRPASATNHGHSLPFHAMTEREALARLGTRPEGLAEAEAAARLKEVGPNELRHAPKRGIIAIFLSQFAGFMVILLMAAALVAAFLGEWVDAAAIFAVLILNAVMGTAQEFRAEKAIEALKKMTAPTARVVRGGREEKAEAVTLVPGDVIVLEAGDRVPADARLIESVMLEVNEAALTGESAPVRKDDAAAVPAGAAVAERANMIFTGTTITAGRGMAVVCATGMNTEFGKIAAAVQEISAEETPLRQNIEKLGRQMAIAVTAACAIIFVLGEMRGAPAVDMLLTSISLAVAAVPEGLPATITIALAIGVQRMSKRNAIVRRLEAVETLGSANVILTDKTGTITKNEMTVQKVFAAGQWADVTGTGYEPVGDFVVAGKKTAVEKVPGLKEMARAAALCNNASLTFDPDKKAYSGVGDPTEVALVAFAEKADARREELKSEADFVQEVPFDSGRKRMTVVYEFGGKGGVKWALMKGAPEVVLERCTRALGQTGEHIMTRQEKEDVLAANKKMAEGALRVIAFAQRPVHSWNKGGKAIPEELEKGMTFVGLAGMIDAPREEVPAALELCAQAGIGVVMITGDNATTAVAVAREVGMFKAGDAVITGAELAKLSDDDLDAKVEKIRVYARVAPEDKLRIVNAWKRRGKVVAVTGDGVNDAPALKRSDIGVSMAITGTDVAKEVSDVVLADDNFASVVSAVEEGRGIYDNIRKCIAYLMSGNIAEVLIIFAAIMFGLPLPLVAIQLLWINLVTDGLPALALAMDPIGRDVMLRPPRHVKESVWKGMRVFLVDGALIATLGVLGVFLLYLDRGLAIAQTMVFTQLIIFEKYYAFSARSLDRPVGRGLLDNKWLVLSTLLTLSLHAAILYLPALNTVFHTVPLAASDWLLAIGVGLVGFLYLEGSKALSHRRAKKTPAAA